MNDIAIKVENLSKCYQIYDKPHQRLLQGFLGNKKKYYKEFWALKDVSFEIKKGETVGIIGRNGSGKSTILQMICGTLTPTSGTVETNGRIAALLELGSGFNPEFTGRENVYMNAAVLGLSQNEIDARYEDIVAFADIGEFIEQPVKTYSSGMFVRLAFAVIANVDASILIIDEALSVGDAVFSQKCYKFLKKFREDGTLLFVSHSMQTVMDLCDRAIWISDQEIKIDNVALEVVQNYNAFIHKLVSKVDTVKVVNKEKVTISDKYQKSINYNYKIDFFDFDFNSTYWGGGGAEVIDIEIFNKNYERLHSLTNSGIIIIRVSCLASVSIDKPVIGISIRNSRGVEYISENSYHYCIDEIVPSIRPNQKFFCDFSFFMPFLASGDYTLGGAIADGIPGNHQQLHRRDLALQFTVINTHMVYGLFSMPLEYCKIYLE